MEIDLTLSAIIAQHICKVLSFIVVRLAKHRFASPVLMRSSSLLTAGSAKVTITVLSVLACANVDNVRRRREA
jgi:hypothetical protein